MTSLIRDYWIYTTVLIENELGAKGTGFLIGDKDETKAYLVTNKHVVEKNENKRRNAKQMILHVNVENTDTSIIGEKVPVQINSEIWKEHPDKDVDVIIYDITHIVSKVDRIRASVIHYENLVTLEMIEKYDIKIADEVIVIGYPFIHELKHRTSNFPIVREGIIATNINEDLEDEYKNNIDGSVRKRLLRGFLIDGAIIPGSSGSPVIVKPSVSRYIRGALSYANFPPMLLGIISESRYSYTEDFQSFANLGLAFKAETIRETIHLFDK
jgi:hypothetical protein